MSLSSDLTFAGMQHIADEGKGKGGISRASRGADLAGRSPLFEFSKQ
jgi:hypothetical protein